MKRQNPLLIAVLLVAFAVGGCGTSGPPVPAANDPTSATVRISGNVVPKGTPMDPPPLTVGDRFCRGKALELWEEQRLTTKAGKVRNAIIYVKSGFERRDYGVPSEPVVVDQQGCVYVPHVLTVMKGQKLRILNSDTTFHNVHARGDKGDVFNIAQAQKGAEDFQSFGHAGILSRL